MRTRSWLVAGIGVLIAVSASACSSQATSSPQSTPSAPARIALGSHPRVYFFGDSWTHGASAAKDRGFPAVVGAALGWTVQVGPDESGAGYVNTYTKRHPVFPTTVASLGPIDADLIVLEGGLNDEPGPLSSMWDSVRTTVKELRSKADGAPIVLVGPSTWDGKPTDALAAIDSAEAGVAASLGVAYVSPLKERWFNTDNIPDLFDAESHHPNTAGHAYYGGRLASALQRITAGD